MRSKATIRIIIISMLVIMLLTACKPATPTLPFIGGPITVTPPPATPEEIIVTTDIPTPVEPTTTRVYIDGYADDWTQYPILLTDWEDDATEGGFDLKSVRTFINDIYLYLMLDSYGDRGEYVQVELDIDVNGDGELDYGVTFQPSTGRQNFGDFTAVEPIWGFFMDGSAAEGEVIELKMSLSLLRNPDNFILTSIRVMGGICCEEEWYVVDDLGPVPIVKTNELEMTRSEHFAYWLSTPFTGVTSTPFIINERDLAGPRALDINQDETRAYVINEFSGELSLVNIDAGSSAFGEANVIKEEIYILTDVYVNQDETLVYLSREAGTETPSLGQHIITRMHLDTGQVVTVTDRLSQPTSIVLNQDETKGYVVDLKKGGLYEVDLGTSVVTPIVTDLGEPYAVAVTQSGKIAYVVTEPAQAGDYPKGSVLRVFMPTGEVTVVAEEIILGAASIALAADEKLAFIAEYGHDGSCDGSISIIDIDRASAEYGQKTVLLSGLCGAYDVELNDEETLAYYLEYDGSRLSAIRINMDEILGQSP